jgi:hypothetical protein
MLQDLDDAVNAAGTSLVFAEMKDPVRRKIERYGLTRTINPEHFYPTIGAAVTAYKEGPVRDVVDGAHQSSSLSESSAHDVARRLQAANLHLARAAPTVGDRSCDAARRSGLGTP